MIAIYINEAEEVEAIMLERPGRTPKLLQEGVHYVTKPSVDMPQLPQEQGVVSTMPDEDKPEPVQDTVQDEPTFETESAEINTPSDPSQEEVAAENTEVEDTEAPELDEMPPLMPEQNPDLLPQNPFGAPNDEQEVERDEEVEQAIEGLENSESAADAAEKVAQAEELLAQRQDSTRDAAWSDVPPSPMPVNEEEDFEDPTLSTTKQPGV